MAAAGTLSVEIAPIPRSNSVDRLAAMETLVYVIETGSFSAAAKRLDLGQPAVSKIIAQLEERLGVRLLLRSTRGLTPTEAGEEFYQRAKRALEDINDAEATVRGAASGLIGRLRICAPVTFARMHVLPHLGDFLARHPKLQVDVVLSDIMIDLIVEGIDVALRLGPLSDSGLVARKISAAPLQIVGTPAYFARAGVPQRPEDLLKHQAVVYTQSRGGGARWVFNRDGETRTVNATGQVQVSAAEGIRTLVRSGIGLALASQWMFAPEQARGEIITVLDDWRLPMMDLWAIHPGGRMTSAKARAFVDFYADILRQDPVRAARAIHSTQE